MVKHLLKKRFFDVLRQRRGARRSAPATALLSALLATSLTAGCAMQPASPLAGATASGAAAAAGEQREVRRIRHWTTANGARVYYLPAADLPIVDLRVVFDAGSARDGDRPGVARLTASALRSGAAQMDVEQIAARLAAVGAQLSVDAMRDMAWLQLRSLSSAAELAPAVEIAAAILGSPSFPEGEIERLKQQGLIALREEQQNPGQIAERAFFDALYGDHPYARRPDEADVRALDRAAVRDFAARHYVASNAVVAIVGDLDRAAAEALAERVTAGLPRGEPAPPLPPVAELDASRTLRIPFPSQQAHILIGQPGLSRGDPDYFSLYLGNHVFGGSGFASRLVGEVREKRGLAYSVYSYFLPMAERGPFQMGLQTRGDQAEGAAELVREELRRFVAEGPSAAEIEASLLNVTGSSPLRTDSNRKLVEYLALIGFYDLPLDYLDAFNARVSAEDAASVRDAFQRRIDPDRLITVIVGGGAE